MRPNTTFRTQEDGASQETFSADLLNNSNARTTTFITEESTTSIAEDGATVSRETKCKETILHVNHIIEVGDFKGCPEVFRRTVQTLKAAIELDAIDEIVESFSEGMEKLYDEKYGEKYANFRLSPATMNFKITEEGRYQGCFVIDSFVDIDMSLLNAILTVDPTMTFDPEVLIEPERGGMQSPIVRLLSAADKDQAMGILKKLKSSINAEVLNATNPYNASEIHSMPEAAKWERPSLLQYLTNKSVPGFRLLAELYAKDGTVITQEGLNHCITGGSSTGACALANLATGNEGNSESVVFLEALVNKDPSIVTEVGLSRELEGSTSVSELLYRTEEGKRILATLSEAGNTVATQYLAFREEIDQLMDQYYTVGLELNSHTRPDPTDNLGIRDCLSRLDDAFTKRTSADACKRLLLEAVTLLKTLMPKVEEPATAAVGIFAYDEEPKVALTEGASKSGGGAAPTGAQLN
jgi:hypothetical protein